MVNIKLLNLTECTLLSDSWTILVVYFPKDDEYVKKTVSMRY
jgi:hypothetical protein